MFFHAGVVHLHKASQLNITGITSFESNSAANSGGEAFSWSTFRLISPAFRLVHGRKGPKYYVVRNTQDIIEFHVLNPAIIEAAPLFYRGLILPILPTPGFCRKH